PSLLELPADRTRPQLQSFRGASTWISIDSSLSERLAVLARESGVTLFMALSAAFALLLTRLSGQNDVVMGVPAANRAHAELAGLIGMFVNTLPLRVTIDPATTIAELLRQVRSTAIAAYAVEDVPFEQVVHELQPQRNLDRQPIFQAMFALNEAVGPPPRWSDLELTAEPVAEPSSKFDLMLEMNASAGGLLGRLSYATDLFDAATVERWGRHFITLLGALAGSAPTRALAELELLDPQERSRIVSGFNHPLLAAPRSQMIHELFAEQARRCPTAVALTCGSEQLTYAQLDERANRLARYLLGLGVGPDVRVAVCAGRG